MGAHYGLCRTPISKRFEVVLNKILRKVWNLPHHSHTVTVHCVALVPTVIL